MDTNAGRDGDDSGEGDTGDGAGVGDAGEKAKEEGGDGAAMPMNDDDGMDAAEEKIGDDAMAAGDDDDSGEWDREDGVRRDRNLCGKNWRAEESESSEEGEPVERELEEVQAARASGAVEGGRQSQGRRLWGHGALPPGSTTAVHVGRLVGGGDESYKIRRKIKKLKMKAHFTAHNQIQVARLELALRAYHERRTAARGVPSNDARTKGQRNKDGEEGVEEQKRE